MEPLSTSDPSDDAFVARCLLGAGWVGANRRLSMLDLRAWAALCALLRSQRIAPPPDDLALDRASSRTVETTGYHLAGMVYAEDGGKNYRLLWRSLLRLSGTRVVVHHVEEDPGLAARRVLTGYVALIGDMWEARTELGLATPAQWGALKGSASLKIEIGQWTAQQVLAGRCVWLDLDVLRALGTGLPARLWAALEAWARWPQRSLDGRETTAIGLGEPALHSLGVARYERPHDARRALDRAGVALVAVDAAYELVRCQRRPGGWALVVERLAGARARAQARTEGGHHDLSIATRNQRRHQEEAEGQVVRTIVRRSLITDSDGAVSSAHGGGGTHRTTGGTARGDVTSGSTSRQWGRR